MLVFYYRSSHFSRNAGMIYRRAPEKSNEPAIFHDRSVTPRLACSFRDSPFVAHLARQNVFFECRELLPAD